MGTPHSTRSCSEGVILAKARWAWVTDTGAEEGILVFSSDGKSELEE